MDRYQVKSKLRFTVFLIALFVIIVSSFSFIFISGISASNSVSQYQCVEVQAGDTVWALAKKHRPKNMDIRKFIGEINELNDLSGKTIEAGDMILMPVYNG